MDRYSKSKSLKLKAADATADIQLINQYAVKPLSPEEVYCFSVVLCDNEVDRDLERFTNKSLKGLAPMFVGKTGISDHRWSADRQIARIYAAEVVETTQKNSLGEPLMQLVAKAYMLNNDANKATIEAIDGGILKEVSVGVAMKSCNCSICGKALKWDWRTWTEQCETGHIKGETYPEGLCVGSLEDPREAYEFSFVAVPAQKGAGVTKSAEDVGEAFTVLLEADLAKCADKSQCEKLMQRLKAAMIDHQEMAERAKILKENEKFLK